jgi:tetratricopeptide (TPR) repeat protein
VGGSGRAEVLKAMNRLPEALDAYEAISAQFPTDVFARNGRAEVLKAMNRLPEALDAYEAISQIYGGDLIARNGRASVLLLMGRTEEALALLPQERPTCLQDWVGWHIFGMALLQAGQEARALENFSVGAEEGPPLESEYFVAAMALAQLRLGYLTEAQRELNRIHNPRLVGATNVVQFQVYAHKRDRAGMEQVSAALEAQGPAVCIELTTELRRRFLENKKGRYSEQWLRDQEIRCLALAA